MRSLVLVLTLLLAASIGTAQITMPGVDGHQVQLFDVRRLKAGGAYLCANRLPDRQSLRTGNRAPLSCVRVTGTWSTRIPMKARLRFRNTSAITGIRSALRNPRP